MSATIAELLEQRPPLVTITAAEPLETAIAAMVKHDYSQLPVIEGTSRPLALVTSDLIARSLNYLGAAPANLRVRDAMDDNLQTCEREDEIEEVLEMLHKTPAVLVIDRQGALTGIVTNYDMLEYFQGQARDVMMVQDVEEMIKTYARIPFQHDEDTFDEQALQEAVDKISPSNDDLRGPFTKAVVRYLELGGQNNPRLEPQNAAKAFQEHLLQKQKGRLFETLTLSDYIELFVHPDRWERYRLEVDRRSLRALLHRVRETRNDLAHFRSDLSDSKRDELRFCRDWLAAYEEHIRAAFRSLPTSPPAAPAPPGAERPEPIAAQAAAGSLPEILPLDEEESVSDSRYAPLARWLSEQPPTSRRLSATFAQIEEVLGGKLPASAYDYRSWWSNTPKGHAQSKGWLDADWWIQSVNSRQGVVIFSRSTVRRAAYRAFFEQLLEKLRTLAPDFEMRPPSGANWHMVGRLPKVGAPLGQLVFSFSRTQFRIEFYIDCGVADKNKALYDQLERRKEIIERALAGNAQWERLDHRRASRVAIYLPGAITDEAGLPALQVLAAQTMVRFRAVISETLESIMKDLLIR